MQPTPTYQILRHGIIDEQQIAKVIAAQQTTTANLLRVPGKLDSHYQPHKSLYYFDDYHMLADFAKAETVMSTPSPGKNLHQLSRRCIIH